MRIDSSLNFLTGVIFERFVAEHYRQSVDVKRILFCAGSVNDIDASAIDMLIALQQMLQRDGIDFYMCAVKKQVWDVMEKAGFIGIIGRDRIFSTDLEAISAMRI